MQGPTNVKGKIHQVTKRDFPPGKNTLSYMARNTRKRDSPLALPLPLPTLISFPQVGDERKTRFHRFNSDEISKLHESSGYPLQRDVSR